MELNGFLRAQRFVGQVLEREGEKDHPLIQWWLSLCGYGFDAHDETAWCSAFVNGVAWDLRLPRTRSAAARSWLSVGVPIQLAEAEPENDVVIFSRGTQPQPDATVLAAPGHVAWFGGMTGDLVHVCGGNQGDAVSLAAFPVSRVLGVRRLA